MCSIAAIIENEKSPSAPQSQLTKLASIRATTSRRYENLQEQEQQNITSPKHVRRKHHRRTPMLMRAQLKIMIILISILYIDDHNPKTLVTISSTSSTSNCRNDERYFGGGFVFFVNAASPAIANARENETVNESENENENETNKKQRSFMKNLNANASPPTPVHTIKNQNTKFIKEFQFRQRRNAAVTANNNDNYTTPSPTPQTFSEILKKAGKSGIGGGISGAIAGIVQVLTLMWLRTVMNYQCRYGSTFSQALRALHNQGGIPRFYRGLSFALIQAPLARFVATASNDGVETLLANFEGTKQWGAGRSTVIASMVVGLWRMVLMPIDTCKTVLQVDSVDGFRSLIRNVKAGKIHVLYQAFSIERFVIPGVKGGTANAISAIASHYPWFYTFRILSHSQFLQNLIANNYLRNALIGFTSSVVSDTFANSIRVVKTAKQSIASKQAVTYREVIAMILAVDGFKGLFGRGLRTRILGNALQSVLFTVIWRGLAERKTVSQVNDTSNEYESNSDVEDLPKKDVPLEEERF